MLSHDEIARAAADFARSRFGSQVVGRVLSEDRIDSQGQDALHLTIVWAPGSTPRLDGDAILGTLVQIHRHLLDAGDERLPLVDYATEDELEELGKPES
jgi:hypothetical protein